MSDQIVKSPFYVLFVDDEDIARKYFEKGMKHYFNVFTAANVDEAIKVVNENHQKIAVVITDQRMPGGNGVKLLKFLRDNYPHTIRLLTTAYSDLSEAIDAVNAGEILRYIQKPWDFGLLRTELQQALELFELRFEHRKLLQEKMMVKRKIAKIERAKSLLILAKNLGSLRCADLAIHDFIRNFANSNVATQDDEEWKSFDFGAIDIAETKFSRDVVEKLVSSLSLLSDYSINEEFNAAKHNAANIKITGNFSFPINGNSFELLLQKLTQLGGELEIKKIEDKIAISTKLSSSQFGNIFSQSPNKMPSDDDIALLLCYLIVYHHGGFVELTKDDSKLSYVAIIPDSQKIISTSEGDLVENAILSTIIA